MADILAAREDGWGSVMDVNCDSWLLNELREKEKMESVRCNDDETLDRRERDEGLPFNSAVRWRYFSKSVWPFPSAVAAAAAGFDMVRPDQMSLSCCR